MQIYLGADHGGWQLKEEIRPQLLAAGYQVIDLGASSLEPADDYPDYAFAVAEQLIKSTGFSSGEAIALLFCRSGSGMAIAANKVKLIRAVEIYDQEIAVHAKEDNWANVLTFAADRYHVARVMKMLNAFMKAKRDPADRHRRRLTKISNYELNH